MNSEKIFNLPKYTPRRQDLRKNSTIPEKRVWEKLRKEQLGFKFRRQHGIGHYIVDFYCPERKLVIEIDGESHFSDEGKEYDYQRDNYLQGVGLKVLRFTNAQITENLDGVLAVIQGIVNEK